ncbi:MAG: carboxypeptidase regulatory-like domain-containing protein [Planctomycetes bacterium]|nr:carboxypeptidase regulatory-like domain-containing protein [Planctomycetota bacterium]
MRKTLTLLFLVVLTAGLAWLVFLGPADPAPAPLDDRPIAAPTGTAPASAGAAQRQDLRQAPSADAFDNRQVKVGGGRHGLHGEVVDESGDPVAGAWVAAYSVPFPLLDFEFDISEIFDKPLDFSLEPLASAFADQEGRFALAGLQGRTLYLTARSHQRLTPRRQRVLPDALDGQEGVVLRTVAGASIVGTVVDPSGAPVAGAEVLVGPGIKYLISAFRNRSFFLERVYTGADGSFAVEAVPARTALTANAFSNAVESGLVEFGPLGRGAEATVQVALGDTGSLSGVVTDLEDEPVARASVVAVPLDLRYVIPFIRDVRAWTADTDGRGRYRFTRLPQALFLLLAQGREGRSAPLTARVTGEGSLAPTLKIDTKLSIEGRVVNGAGRPVANALVRLQSIPTGVEEGGRNERQRMNSPGGIFIEAARELLPELLPDSTTAKTDGQGRFRMPAWSQARLRVSAPGYTEADFRLSGLAEDKKPVLQIWKPGSIGGQVVDDLDDRPVRFYLVRGNAGGGQPTRVAEAIEMVPVDPEADPIEHESAAGPDWLAEDEQLLGQQEASWRAQLGGTTLVDSEDGRFLLKDIPPGSWRLTVQAEGYENGAATSVVVAEGERTEDVVIRLGRGAMISGRVLTSSTRAPVAGAIVTAGRGEESGFLAMLQGMGESVAMAETGEDGGYRLTGVPGGSDHVNVAADGYASASQKIPEMKAGEVRDGVEVVVMDGGSITGFVFDRHGVPLPARMVGAASMQARDFQQTATDEQGRYRMEHMRPGSYFMMAADLEDESLFTGDIMTMLGSSRITTTYVKDGEVTELDIVDPSAGGCRLEGKLMANGVPVPGANLMLLSAEGSGLLNLNLGFSTSRTNEKGEFLFKSLAPGEYRVQVESDEWRGALPLEVWEVPEDYQVLEVPVSGVRGRVVSARDGSPVPDASVVLVSDEPQAGGLAAMFGGGAERKWEQADETGYYSFEGVAPGRYHLEVSASAPWRPRGQPELELPLGKVETDTFRLMEREVKEVATVQLPVAGSIRVRATLPSGAGGNPWFTATARLEGAEEPEAGPGGGRFGRPNQAFGQEEAVITGLEEGTYDVVVSGGEWVETTVTGVVVRAGEVAETSVVLTRGVRLRVRVLDASNNPVSPSDIALIDAQGKRVNDRTAGIGAVLQRMFGQPEIDLGTHRPGFYTIRVSHDGRTVDQPVSLTEGSSELVEVRV